MSILDKEKITDFYNSVDDVWAINDPWHDYSRTKISKFLSKQTINKNGIVLNAGSAGNTYNITCSKMYHIDIAAEKIKNLEFAFVGNIENMPFENNYFDNIICVGSVLNYCDALAAISELSRVLKLNGQLFLEFESSLGYEYLGTDNYKKNACVITTEYIEKEHKQWLYSTDYIIKILQTSNLNVVQIHTFHIIDGLLSKFISDKFSVKFTKIFDRLLCLIPPFKKHGNNIIVKCIKIS